MAKKKTEHKRKTFTHGTSEQRMYCLKKGIETGDWNTTTFAPGDLD